MFSIERILKRSWQILWSYKVLWFFGFLLVLAGGGGGGGSNGGGSGISNRFHPGTTSQPNFNLPLWSNQAQTWFETNLGPWFATPERTATTIFWIILAIFAFAVVVGLILSLVRYPAETAVIRMVADHEATGSKVGFRQSWHLGWNRRAFRMWVIDLIMSVPGLVFGAGFAAAAIVIVSRAIAGQASALLGPRIAVFFILFAVLLIPVILLAVFLGILRQYMVRYAAIDGTTVGESLAKGWALFKRHVGNTFLLWIVMVGVGIGAAIALSLVFFLLIPTYIVMAIPAAIVAAIPGAIAYGITTIFNAHLWPWIIGGLVALPFFFQIALSPLFFVSGWVRLFTMNAWTLTFQELRSSEALPPQVPPVPAQPPLPAAPAEIVVPPPAMS